MSAMAVSPSIGNQLSWLIEQELEQMDALAALLREESQLLLAREPERLEQLLESKSLRVSELATLDKRREELFRNLGIPNESKKVEKTLDALFPGRGLGDRWRQLAALAEGCQQLNRINSATIEIGQVHLSQALRILRGDSSETCLYGADGASKPRPASRLIGQA